MPRFYNKKYNYFVSSAYKVMVSSLNAQPDLENVSNRRMFIIMLRNTIRFKRNKQYIIVRNPIDRFISFYKDKFIQHPQYCLKVGQFEWQHCQLLYFKELGIEKLKDEDQAKHLDNTNINSLVKLLPLHYLNNGHTQPQNLLLKLRVKLPFRKKYRKLRLRRINVLKLEDLTNEFLEIELHLNPSIRSNSTQKVSTKIELNQKSVDILKSLYANDFSIFNYTV
jgi:hypothetical protein